MTVDCQLAKSSNAEASNQPELATVLFISAMKELAAFFIAVKSLFGAEQASQSDIHWIEVLESMDWPSDEPMPNWRQVTLAASARLGTGTAAKVAVPKHRKALKGNGRLIHLSSWKKGNFDEDKH
jgi:hypothetical protein